MELFYRTVKDDFSCIQTDPDGFPVQLNFTGGSRLLTSDENEFGLVTIFGNVWTWADVNNFKDVAPALGCRMVLF